MRYAIIIAALLLTGCREYKCVDGQILKRWWGESFWVVDPMRTATCIKEVKP